MILTTVDKTMISDIKFIYLDSEEIILYDTNKISIKKSKRDKLFYEISDKNQEKIFTNFSKVISKVQISFKVMENINVLIEIPFKYEKDIIYSSFYFNKYCEEIKFPCVQIYNIFFKELIGMKNIKYEIGYIEEKTDEYITVLSKGVLPITMSSFIRKLEINEKYYEHYLLI
ncbi:MAG: hypothetical protein MJH09_01395 [Cetobacterium sp.]|nr:hypothetical protein [Cetobacterium sp.]